MKKYRLGYFSLFLICLLTSQTANAQVPKIDPNTTTRIVVVTDDNFEPQKQTDRGPSRRGRLLYEVWITTDGILHCKTSKLSSASIAFTPPTVNTANASGGGTTVGGGKSRLLSVSNGDFSDNHYTFNIKPDKYREMHKITLSIRSGLLGSAEVELINKKIPAEISK